MNMPEAVNANTAASGVTRALVDHSQRLRFSALPNDVKEIARLCVLDWVGVALAGARDELTHLLLREAITEGGKPVATVVGHVVRVAPLQAALINGASSHVLDYDDVNLSMNGHPSAAVLPALLS
ncbi:MAG TPA: MmgE/PrpD family protein, partial [Burkholderiales bacterium]